MTDVLFLICAVLAAICFAFSAARRYVRVHTVHRPSVHFPEATILFADVILDRKPVNGMRDPSLAWCTDCGWQGTMGHAADCPRITGQRCPRCGKPKRTTHMCHHCGFAGFVILFDFEFPPKRRLGSTPPAKTANQAKAGSPHKLPVSCDLEDL